MIGRVFLGRYEVQRLLGEGGMGRVYLARQTDLGRQVVVKVMHDHIAADPKFRDRFQRETVLMARFQHPYAVTLYDAILNDPAGPCIVMEYVKGTNLEALLAKNKRLTAPRVGRIMIQLCEVLQAAHDEGMIHRDLKPANLMILDADTPRERIKVMDFGLAKLVEEAYARKVTDTNIDFAVGTPGYICPEQVRGESMDHRGDIYSVGVMMYELLTGRLPFQGASSMDVLLAHATEAPPGFDELGLAGWVPRTIEELVLDCLAKDPDDRPQSSRELAERFERGIAAAQAKADSRVQLPGLPDPAVGPQDSPVPLSLDTPPPSSRATPSRTTGSGREVAGLPFHMEAWMPESIAVMKLRGFVHDCGGEVLDCVPGLIKVRLGKSRTPTTTSWFGFAKRSGGPIDVELHMQKANPKQEHHLSIQVLFRPSHPSLLADDVWKSRCNRLFVELRGYLMGNPSV
ncbi:MAG TPA: serine/threonine-protein kinase [Fimbriiglobus sp.]|nr:serine/threonine-protein kinase [Fimbriiglobus sp.]